LLGDLSTQVKDSGSLHEFIDPSGVNDELEGAGRDQDRSASWAAFPHSMKSGILCSSSLQGEPPIEALQQGYFSYFSQFRNFATARSHKPGRRGLLSRALDTKSKWQQCVENKDSSSCKPLVPESQRRKAAERTSECQNFRNTPII
jgi:hypothetical protein